MSLLGAKIAEHLCPGTTVLLDGPIGAGKTHLARSIIQARLPIAEEVPSPTYTIVQTYKVGETEIWHADLYRISDSLELIELGLDEAFETAIALVEWPDRLPAALVPDSAISIEIKPAGEMRFLNISAPEGPIFDLLSGYPHA